MAKTQDTAKAQQAILTAFEVTLRAQMEKQADKLADLMIAKLEQFEAKKA